MIRKIALFIFITCVQFLILAQDSIFTCKVQLIEPIKKNDFSPACNQLFGHEKYLIQSVFYNDTTIQVAFFCSILNSQCKKGVKKGEYVVTLKKARKEDLFDESLTGIEVYKYVPFIIVNIDLKARNKRDKSKIKKV